MKEHELQQILGAVKEQVEITVNDNIREIKKHLEAQDERFDRVEAKIDALKVETAPIVESKNVIVGLRKALLYFAAPIGIGYAIWQFLVDKLK